MRGNDLQAVHSHYLYYAVIHRIMPPLLIWQAGHTAAGDCRLTAAIQRQGAAPYSSKHRDQRFDALELCSTGGAQLGAILTSRGNCHPSCIHWQHVGAPGWSMHDCMQAKQNGATPAHTVCDADGYKLQCACMLARIRVPFKGTKE